MSDLQSYQHLLETSRRVNWGLDELVAEGLRLDFSRPFLPEIFAQTRPLGFLSPEEKLKLNQIRARGYLALFELLETLVVAFISQQADEGRPGEPFRAEALHNFVAEEQKHRQLFSTVLRAFDERFGVPCRLIGPADEICKAILGHGTMAVTIAILGFEWMSQGHYLGSVKDNQQLDSHFKNLLKHHWMEEAQHARLDGLLLQSLARGSSPAEIEAAIGEFFEIGAFLDAGFKQQSGLDLESVERAIARRLSQDDRQRFVEEQHGALRWTFLGSVMGNRNFLAVLAGISDQAAARVAQAATSFTLPGGGSSSSGSGPLDS